MILVVHNAKSGRRNSLPDIKQALKKHGLQAEYIAITAPHAHRTIAKMTKSKNTIIVAAGGDGTVSTVAEKVQGTPARLGIIPTGTLNHFAKELDIPLNVSEAAKLLQTPKSTLVDLGSVNGHTFINNSSIGWYPRALHTRDELGDRVGKWPAMLMGSLRAILRPRHYRVELVVDGQPHTYRTPFVFIGNNAYKRAQIGLGRRQSLQDGQLAIYVVKAQSLWGIVRMLVHGLFTRRVRSRDFAIHRATQCTIRTGHHHLNVATDGEVQRLSTPLHYQSQPKTLRVIVP